MIDKYRITLVTIVLSMLSFNASSAAYTCTGQIDAINQGYDGSVSVLSVAIYGDGQGRKVCSLNELWKGVTVDTCKGWLSKLLSFEARNSDITIQYNGAVTSCATQPAWESAEAPWSMW